MRSRLSAAVFALGLVAVIGSAPAQAKPPVSTATQGGWTWVADGWTWAAQGWTW